MAFRKHKESLQFRNGNLNLRISKEDLEDFNKDQVLFLSDHLFWLDCEFVGETFCLNNFETGHIIYNTYVTIFVDTNRRKDNNYDLRKLRNL